MTHSNPTEPLTVPSTRVDMRRHEVLNESWLQKQIAENPSLLGLGDFDLIEREVHQPGGGRLDLLLVDPETSRRYEVEIQLGSMDPSHIIRTIEYWDIESRRYPQYEHVAVLVAENVSSTYLNVVLRISGQIPLIVLQINVLDVKGTLTLVVTKVLDLIPLATDTGVPETAVSRDHWTSKSSKESIKIVDSLLRLINAVEEGVQLNYTKHYIGLSQKGKSQNFVEFRPRKDDFVLVNFKVPKDPLRQEELEQAGMDVLPHDGSYRIRLRWRDITEHEDRIVSLIKAARDEMLGTRN